MKARVHLSLRMLDLIDRYSVTVREVGDGNVDRADVRALHADAAPPTSPTAILTFPEGTTLAQVNEFCRLWSAA